MARTYGKIHVAIWKDVDYKALTMGEQWLYEALVSQPDLTLCGLIIYRAGRWSKLCANATADMINELLRSLADKRYLVIDWDTEEVLIRSFCRNDGGAKHSKILIGIESAIKAIESESLRAAAQTELDRALNEEGTDADSDASGSGTDTQSERNGLPIDSVLPQLAASSSSLQCSTSSSSLQCSTSSSSEQGAAAAALDLYIEYRLNTETGIRSPRRYGENIRRDESALQGKRLHELEQQAMQPRAIVETVWGISQANLARHTRTTRSVS